MKSWQRGRRDVTAQIAIPVAVLASAGVAETSLNT